MKLRLEPHYLPAILLLATASLLVLKIGTELARDQHSTMPSSQQKSGGSPDLTLALQAEFFLPPMEKAYDAMLARPLFSPSRRLLASPADAALLPSMRKGQFTLLGVIITKGKEIAMLREIATGKVLNVEQGREINGLQLEQLLPEKVTLRQGEEREELMLKIQPVTNQPPLASPPVADNAVNAVQAATVAPVPVGAPQTARRPMSNAMQELINRRRGLHGLPMK